MNLNYSYSCERGRDFWNCCGKLWMMHEMKKSLPSAQGIQKGFCSQHCAALCYGLCALWGEGFVFFEKHPAFSTRTKVNKRQNERKKKEREITPDTQEHLRCKTGALFPTSAFPAPQSCQVLHVWGRFSSPEVSCS